MSMHEIEDLVEYSIRALAAADKRDQLDVRSACWWLYDFQNHWDTSFTHFRVIDILLDFRFAYRFGITRHPDYEHYRDTFEALTDFAFIFERPTEPHGKTRFDPIKGWTSENPYVGYYKAPYLYCDAGSGLWKRLVENRTLTGRDAEPPDAKMDITGAVLAVARYADLNLICDWYAYLALQLASFDDDFDSLRDDPALAEFVTLTQQLDIPANRQRSPVPLMALRRAYAPLVESAGAYIDQIKAIRAMQNDPNL